MKSVRLGGADLEPVLPNLFYLAFTSRNVCAWLRVFIRFKVIIGSL
jgi:hypothetical protein